MPIENHLDTLTEIEFKIKLIEFFERHDKSALSAVDNIVSQFSDRKAEVFAQLTEKYSPKGTTSRSTAGGPPMGANAGALPIS